MNPLKGRRCRQPLAHRKALLWQDSVCALLFISPSCSLFVSTDGAEICSDKSLCKSDSAFSTTRSDVIAMKDSKDVAVVYNSDGPNLAYVSSAASSSSGDLTAVTSRMKDAEDAAGAAAEGTQPQGAAASAPTSLCPVVALASFAGQLTFKAVMHLAVFAGEGRAGVSGSLR